MMEVALECPRGNGEHKIVLVDPADPKHTRLCKTCNYQWVYREGMPTYAGETFCDEAMAAPAPPAAGEVIPPAPETPPAERPRRR